jgi:hypothetical protein
VGLGPFDRSRTGGPTRARTGTSSRRAKT